MLPLPFTSIYNVNLWSLCLCIYEQPELQALAWFRPLLAESPCKVTSPFYYEVSLWKSWFACIVAVLISITCMNDSVSCQHNRIKHIATDYRFVHKRACSWWLVVRRGQQFQVPTLKISNRTQNRSNRFPLLKTGSRTTGSDSTTLRIRTVTTSFGSDSGYPRAPAIQFFIFSYLVSIFCF